MSHIKHESTRENINRWKINNLWQSCNFVASARCSLYIIRSSADSHQRLLSRDQDAATTRALSLSAFFSLWSMKLAYRRAVPLLRTCFIHASTTVFIHIANSLDARHNKVDIDRENSRISRTYSIRISIFSYWNRYWNFVIMQYVYSRRTYVCFHINDVKNIRINVIEG